MNDFESATNGFKLSRIDDESAEITLQNSRESVMNWSRAETTLQNRRESVTNGLGAKATLQNYREPLRMEFESLRMGQELKQHFKPSRMGRNH